MEFRQLGKNGPQVSVLGLGAWPLGGGMGHVDDDTAIKTIRSAIDMGITLLDTAQAYRSSESTVGRALKDGYRQRCFLATKVSGNYSKAGIRSAMENSLRALQVDCVSTSTRSTAGILLSQSKKAWKPWRVCKKRARRAISAFPTSTQSRCSRP